MAARFSRCDHRSREWVTHFSPIHPVGLVVRIKKGKWMQRTFRLRKNKQFQYVYHKGKSCACRELVLLYVRNPRLQVGFSVSRKVGNSVVRNRVKRRLREQFKVLMPRLRTGLYVIIARNAAAKADSQVLGRSLGYLLRQQKLFREEGRE